MKKISYAVILLLNKIKNLTFFCGRKIKGFSKLLTSSIGRYSFAFFVFSILGIVVFFVKKTMTKGM